MSAGTPPSPPARAGLRTRVVLFVLVWLSCVWFGSWAFNPNNATRMFAAVSLVETGDATIDEFAPLTIDKAQFGGHAYMDKAPGVTLMALPWVALVTTITDRRSASVPLLFGAPETEAFLRLRQRAAIAGGAALLTALAALSLLDLGTRTTGSVGAGLFAALAFALGTPIWGWSTTLFGHAPVAALLAIATWAAWRATDTVPTRPPVAAAAIAGAALGWAAVVEHPSVLMGAAVALFAAWRTKGWPAALRWRTFIPFVAAGTVMMLPLFAYSMVAFGTPLRIGYSGVVGFDGMQQGLFGLTYPKAAVLWEIVVGHRRGIIWVAPVMLVAPFGLARLVREPATRELGWLAVAGTTIAFLYNASYVYWDGGHSTGPRHAMPAMAFAAIALAPLFARAGRRRRWLLGALLALSIALNAIIAAAEITSPDTFAFPLWEHVIAENFAHGWLRTLPSEFARWTPWQGFRLYCGLALLLAAALPPAGRSTPG